MLFPNRIFALLVCLSLIAAAGCKKEDPEEQPEEFDRGAMMGNYADNVIVPRYEALQVSINALNTSANAFVNAPGATTLADLRNDWETAYLSWQRCSMFEFGPAADVVMRSTFNTFPTDTSDIANNIASGTWTLDAASNIDAIGFPALDYLLFGIAASEEGVVLKYTNGTLADSRKAYLTALVEQLKNKIDLVLANWNGGYRDTFVANTGTDIGSSLSLMVNDLNFDYELIKNAKVGIPLGTQTLGIARPHYTEAYYAGISKSLAMECLRTSRDIYRGMSLSGNNGVGIDDYLEFLGAQHTSGSLHNAIMAQFSESESTLGAVPDPLSESIVSAPEVVENAYNDLQQHVVLYKTDMPSALGVLITYADGDGD